MNGLPALLAVGLAFSRGALSPGDALLVQDSLAVNPLAIEHLASAQIPGREDPFAGPVAPLATRLGLRARPWDRRGTARFTAAPRRPFDVKRGLVGPLVLGLAAVGGLRSSDLPPINQHELSVNHTTFEHMAGSVLLTEGLEPLLGDWAAMTVMTLGVGKEIWDARYREGWDGGDLAADLVGITAAVLLHDRVPRGVTLGAAAGVMIGVTLGVYMNPWQDPDCSWPTRCREGVPQKSIWSP